MAAKGGRGSPLKEKPNMASSTTSKLVLKSEAYVSFVRRLDGTRSATRRGARGTRTPLELALGDSGQHEAKHLDCDLP